MDECERRKEVGSGEVGSGGNIITPALPGSSACPLILRGLFRWCNPIIIPLLR